MVIFKPELGNMQQPNLTQDWREEKTAVLLLGQGANENRDEYYMVGGSVNDTPYSYSLIVADARQVDDGDATQYITQAYDALAEGYVKETFTFGVGRAADLYRTYWNLGDLLWTKYDEQW